jgi:precorrin-2/cobalt-factor-2 C20-methyltransferase
MSARLTAIGAGPGDPELITLLGLRCLQEADTVFFPSTRQGSSLARLIAGRYVDPARQQVVELHCPAFRDQESLQKRWLELGHCVSENLQEDRAGAFVCEGDPSLYSTFFYLRRSLEQISPQMEIRTVPGVNSVSAAAALSDIPLAIWDQRLLVAPATDDLHLLQTYISGAETLALVKAGGKLDGIMDAIEQIEPSMQVALVRRAGLPEQQVLTDPAEIRSAQPDYFTTLLLRRGRL